MDRLMALALLSGCILPVQASINGRLGRELQSPALASLASFLIGSVALIGYVFASKATVPATQTLLRLPVWLWFGGLLGTIYMIGVVRATPQLGVAMTTGLVIAGQLLVSVTLDHFGLLGLPQHPINTGRIVGLILLALGVLLLKRY